MSQEAQQGTNSAKRRFAAFMSYAHADAAIAAKLQGKLERYRLPKHIAAAHAEGQAALGQIFRDREDLAAAPSLSEAIRAAISEAEALVVICSPDAKASRWVGEEIALFRALHPDGPVLAAIVRGEPAQAFPEALTEGGTEPLAADLRAEADGEALGFLKIVAGIAGVPLDALVQRDAQRRIRRVMWITGGAIAAMLIMGLMTTLAIQSRNEAARQRAEAEGLLEYMLTDLRDKLKGVGRLDVMGAVNDRAMEYYGGGSVQGQLLKARILHAQGEDFEKQGELEKAADKFKQADEATSTLFNAHPTDPDVIFAHAQSEYWVGRVSQLQKDWKQAERRYGNYRDLAGKLHLLDGSNKRAFLEMAHADINLGIIAFSAKKDPQTARRHFSKAQGNYARAANINPVSDQEIYFRANTAAWLADTYFAEGDFQNSLEQRRAELSFNEQVARRDRNNAAATVLVAKAQLALGKNYLSISDPANAETVLAQAKATMQQITALDAANDEWAYLYFRVTSNLAIAAHDNGRRATARSNFAEMNRFVARYKNENPTLFEKMQGGLTAVTATTGLN
jgi:hypothetical protein